jgi:hypothetical protein
MPDRLPKVMGSSAPSAGSGIVVGSRFVWEDIGAVAGIEFAD